MTDAAKTKLDLLLIFYNFSDQHGVVDIQQAGVWAKAKLGVNVSSKPFTLTQKHFNYLMDRGIIPDTRDIICKLQASDRNPPLIENPSND